MSLYDGGNAYMKCQLVRNLIVEEDGNYRKRYQDAGSDGQKAFAFP